MGRLDRLALGVFAALTFAAVVAVMAARDPAPAPDGMVDVLLVLPEAIHAPPSAGRGKGARARKAAVAAMRQAALASQGPLRERLEAQVRRRRVASYHPLWLVNAIALRARPEAVRELREAYPGLRVVDDLPVRPVVTPLAGGGISGPPPDGWNVDRVTAPDVWDLGFRGQGTVVAVMDSGVDARHPDLAVASYLGPGPGWCDVGDAGPGAADLCPGRAVPNDEGALSGHGTAVMGVLVGGEVTGEPVGIAPAATWIAVRIFDDDGLSDLSDALTGLEWLAALAEPPDVINMSWEVGRADGGTPCDGAPYTLVQDALANLRALGAFLVAASGNDNVAHVPAAFLEVFAVGATNKLDYRWDFSGRGLTTCRPWPGPRTYPDVVAPGDGVVTPDYSNGGFLNYRVGVGTSVAAPHAAGAAALLLSAFPDLPPDELQTALAYGAAPAAGGTQTTIDNEYGYGLVDALSSFDYVLQTRVARPPRAWVTESPGGLAFAWSPAPDPGRPITYTVLRDGAVIATGLGVTAYDDPGADPLAGHVYEVVAVDAADEASAPTRAMLGNIARDNAITRDRIDAFDLVRVHAAMGTSAGDPGWDPAGDLTGDGTVDSADRDRLADLFGHKEVAP